MGNPDVKSHVTEVHLLDDKHVVLNVLFDGFTAGEPVEISGYLTQTDGAYSSFYLYTTAPTPTASETWVTVPVTIDKEIEYLRDTDHMTVVAKVAKVWPTVLESGSADPGKIDPAILGTRTVERTWTALPPPGGEHY